MECPYIRIEESGATIPLRQDVTTVGRGRFVDVQLADPSVSMLHARLSAAGPTRTSPTWGYRVTAPG